MKIKNNLMKKSFVIIIVFSLIFNILFFCVDLLPQIIEKINKPNYLSSTNNNQVESKLVQASFEMVSSTKMHMPWARPNNFIDKIRALRLDETTRIYNFPRAYLALGLIKYGNKFDSTLVQKVIPVFDDYYLNGEELAFKFEYVDQVPLGFAALELYKITGNSKYKKMANIIYGKLRTMVTKHGKYSIILYRDHQDDLFVDAIGMVCPFLMEYGLQFKNREAIQLAESELEFFMTYGLDGKDALPFHAIDLKLEKGLGPNNWGRGMGWYMLALESVMSNLNSELDTVMFMEQNKLSFLKNIKNLKDSTLYTEFPGTSKGFDSSTSTMLMYGSNVLEPGTYTIDSILTIFKPFIKENGILDRCSGDAFGVDKYSLEFGESELSQGMILMLLSTTSSNKALTR